MKIKLLLLTDDKSYIDKFLSVVTLQYADRLNISIFTQTEGLENAIQVNRPDILLVGDEFSDVVDGLPSSTTAVHFVEQKGVQSKNNHRAICKYQAVSAIFQELLDIYAETTGSSVVLQGDPNSSCNIITFCSPAGGVGTSVAAASYATRLASQGKKVLYLNLEPCGTSDIYFDGASGGNFSRVIYALAMANGTISMKLESSVSRCASDVFFYSGCESALDLLELDLDTMEQLFHEFEKTDLFEWIVVDMEFSFSERMYRQIGRSLMTVFVSNGSERANVKLERCLTALSILDAQGTTIPLNRIAVLYNCFSSKTGSRLQGELCREIGGINRFENATTQELIRLISSNPVFDNLLQPVPAEAET